MVTLSVSNRDRVDVMFEAATEFEAKPAVGDWVHVKYAFTVPRIAPGGQVPVLLLAPASTSACRLRLSYQTQIWKCRVMDSLGLRGRVLVAKSRLLRKLVWPDELKTMPVPPRWRQATIEAVFPAHASSPPAGTHNEADAPNSHSALQF